MCGCCCSCYRTKAGQHYEDSNQNLTVRHQKFPYVFSGQGKTAETHRTRTEKRFLRMGGEGWHVSSVANARSALVFNTAGFGARATLGAGRDARASRGGYGGCRMFVLCPKTSDPVCPDKANKNRKKHQQESWVGTHLSSKKDSKKKCMLFRGVTFWSIHRPAQRTIPRANKTYSGSA